VKRRIIVMIAVLCGVLALSTCDFILPPGQAGEIRFDLGLAQPRQLGYEVTAVRCTLQHQVSGTLVVQDLNVEGESATGLIRGLRTGWWNLTVELLEGEEVIGTATSEVEVLAGQTARVVLQVDLATGDLEIVVNWKNGGMILDLDLGELVGAGYEIAEVEYTLTHNASGQTIGGQVVPDGTTAYAEVPELWIGTWTVEVALWQPGADEPLCTTQYDLDVGPGLIEELNLEVTSLEPVGAILVPYTPTQLYGWPDLTVASFEAPASAAPGEPIGALVSVEVMNDGIGIAPATADDGAFTVSFYLSQFSYHGPFSELLASAEVPTPVAPGETVAVEVPASLSVPEATPTGNFYLIVVVDDDGEVAELSDSNNVASAAVVVDVQQDPLHLVLSFEGDPATYFDTLPEEQCHWTVLEEGANPFTADPIVEGVFTTSGGEYSHSIALDAGAYDVYVWFDLDGEDGGSMGDPSAQESITISDTDVALDLWTEVVCGTLALPDTSGWDDLEVYVALLVWFEGDLVDLYDAGLISEDDDRGFAWRTDAPGADEVSFAVDVTYLVYETGTSEYYLAAWAEEDGNGAPDGGEPYGFYGYPGGILPPDPSTGMNVDLNAKEDVYDFTIEFY